MNDREQKFKEYLTKYTEIKELYLDVLEDMARQHRETGYCEANSTFFGFREGDSFKVRLTNVVGFMSKREELKSSQVYDFIYDMIYGSLPDYIERAENG